MILITNAMLLPLTHADLLYRTHLSIFHIYISDFRSPPSLLANRRELKDVKYR